MLICRSSARELQFWRITSLTYHWRAASLSSSASPNKPEELARALGPDEGAVDRHARIGRGPGRRYALRSNDMMAMCQAASQGWGIALLPRFLAESDGRLQRLPSSVAPPSLPVSLVMHADARRAPRVRCTADALVALFGRHGHELLLSPA